jgi:hypothetical protein
MHFRQLFFAITTLITVNHAVCMETAVDVIDKSRITRIDVRCVAFDESTKHISFGVMDAT